MPTYPYYDFTDPDLDYATVEETVQLMYSDLNSQSQGCCRPKKSKDILAEAAGYMQATAIDAGKGDVTRYRNDVMISYQVLYNYITFK